MALILVRICSISISYFLASTEVVHSVSLGLFSCDHRSERTTRMEDTLAMDRGQLHV
jgi:hypothetical protein